MSPPKLLSKYEWKYPFWKSLFYVNFIFLILQQCILNHSGTKNASLFFMCTAASKNQERWAQNGTTGPWAGKGRSWVSREVIVIRQSCETLCNQGLLSLVTFSFLSNVCWSNQWMRPELLPIFHSGPEFPSAEILWSFIIKYLSHHRRDILLVFSQSHFC